ncbi:MAG: hypothetical protein P4L53_07655 [Candidatus Obscuribacterales bacterium]|nr:hypothetical protein [Candidatus Obscuribacterales bacterium]
MAVTFGSYCRSTLLALALLSAVTGQVEAKRAFARGPNGSVGAFNSQGQYGSRMGARVLGQNAGAGFRHGQFTGPNGGSLNGNGNFAYKRGAGGFRNSAWNGTAPKGASGSGYSHSQYNAQTGQGARSSSEQLATSSGKDYGYTGDTSFTKGQGGSSVVQTDNHGTYDVNFAKGQKPVVAPVP